MNAEDIQALLEKAKTGLGAAESLIRDGYYDFAASRLYYVMFYVASALLAHLDQSYSKHSAVISAFGREYAKTGKLDAKFHRWLIDAQDFRNIGDYGLQSHVSEKQARNVQTWAWDFLQAAEKFLRENLGAGG